MKCGALVLRTSAILHDTPHTTQVSCPKLNTLYDIIISYTMYQSGTWLISIRWTVVCSQDFCLFAGYRLAIGWLCPKINTLQDIVIYYYVSKLHMAAINTLDCTVSTKCFGYQLAIRWLAAGYWLAMSPNQYTSKHNPKLQHSRTRFLWACPLLFRSTL